MLCTCIARREAFASYQRPTRTLYVALDDLHASRVCRICGAPAVRIPMVSYPTRVINVTPVVGCRAKTPLSTAISRAAGSSFHSQPLTAHLACVAEQRTPNSTQIMWSLAVSLLLIGCAAAQYPLEVGLVPNDQYTADAAPAPYGTEGWRTGRSTFFDGSTQFKNAYLTRYGIAYHPDRIISDWPSFTQRYDGLLHVCCDCQLAAQHVQAKFTAHAAWQGIARFKTHLGTCCNLICSWHCCNLTQVNRRSIL